MEIEVEDSIGFKTNLSKFTAPRAQSSHAPLLESADDWKVQFDVNDEGFRTRSDHSPLRLLLSLDRALVPMVSSGPCRQDSDMDRAQKPLGGESHQEAFRKDGQVQ